MPDVGEPVAGDNFEPDNTMERASRINFDDPQTHSISPVTEDPNCADHDWMTFTVEASKGIKIETSGPSGDTVMHLYDEEGNIIGYDDGGSYLFSKINIELEPGTYYIKIEEYYNDDEILSYNINLTEGVVDVYEPDNSPYEANSIGPYGGQQTHCISPAYDADWVYFDVPSYYYLSPMVKIETSGPSYDDTRMWLYDYWGNFIAYDDDGGTGFFSKILFSAIPGMRYFVVVDEYGNNNEIEEYAIRVDVY